MIDGFLIDITVDELVCADQEISVRGREEGVSPGHGAVSYASSLTVTV